MTYPPNYHAEHDETKVFDTIDAIVQTTLIVPGDDGMHFSYVHPAASHDRALDRLCL